VVTTFTGISSLVEVLTASGASRIANSKASPTTHTVGKALLKAALVLQLGVMGIFLLTAVTFHRRCKRHGVWNKQLSRVLHTLYFSCILITIRTIYRTVEYFISANTSVRKNTNPDTFNPILRYEVFFYIFEASLMLINSTLLNILHPAASLPRNNKVYLARDGKTEIEGPGYKDRRKFILTLVDPFDVWGLIKGVDKKDRFWENDGIVPVGDQHEELVHSTKEAGHGTATV
jgi:hypothetical protein